MLPWCNWNIYLLLFHFLFRVIFSHFSQIHIESSHEKTRARPQTQKLPCHLCCCVAEVSITLQCWNKTKQSSLIAGPEARAGLIIWHLLVGQYTSGCFFYVNVLTRVTGWLEGTLHAGRTNTDSSPILFYLLTVDCLVKSLNPAGPPLFSLYTYAPSMQFISF